MLVGGSQLARLRRKADFERLVRQGRFGSVGPVSVRVCANEAGQVRVGLAVSRRLGKAVVRNRVRRRLREAVRAELEGIPGSVDLLITARPGSVEATFGELRRALRDALKRAGAWRTSQPR